MRELFKDRIFRVIVFITIVVFIIIFYILFSKLTGRNKSEVASNSNETYSNIDNSDEQDSENYIEDIDEEPITNGESVTYDGKELKVYKTKSGDSYSVVGTIMIDKLNVRLQILSKYTDEIMKISVCRLYGPKYPNQEGNFCIIGHNYRNTKFFSKLSTLEIGDTFKLVDVDENFVTYKIYDKYTVEPTDVSCLEQNNDGKRIVTLITCTDDLKLRYIVKAKEI